MKYSRINHIKRYLKIQEIVKEKYDPDLMTYAKFFRQHIYPIYPMSYHRFITIINMSGLKKELEKEISEQKGKSDNQLTLF